MDEKLTKNLKALIIANNMSVLELSKKLKVPNATLDRIFTGVTQKPKADILKKIADYFSLQTKDLTEDISFRTLKNYFSLSKDRALKTCSWSLNLNGELDFLNTAKKVFTDMVVSDNAFSLIITKDQEASMFPLGTTLICDYIAPKHGNYVIIQRFNALYLRRLLIKNNLEYFMDLTRNEMEAITDKEKIHSVVLQFKVNCYE